MAVLSVSRKSEREAECVYLLFQLGGDAVTCVKLKESIDHVLAVGYSSGSVCIFQFSTEMPGKSQQVTYTSKLCSYSYASDNDFMICVICCQ